MDRRVVGLALSLVVVGAVAIYAFSSLGTEPTYDATGMFWDVSEGDHFRYHALVHGFNHTTLYHSGNGSPYESDSPLTLEWLNDTVILVTIADLPSLPSSVSSESFISEVILQHKTSVVFENETPLPLGDSYFIASLVSQAIFPVGDWDLIDQLFDNSIPGDEIIGSWYSSSLEAGSLWMNYTFKGPDYGSDWSVNWSTAHGKAHTILYDYWNLVEDVSLRIELNLLR
ncbi:MAG: hypothetical protein ACXAEN_18580 [Candidatus Thorarchaeota archaeon]|jgi:hypothetical protein